MAHNVMESKTASLLARMNATMTVLWSNWCMLHLLIKC
jgi:hypothetical protein